MAFLGSFCRSPGVKYLTDDVGKWPHDIRRYRGKYTYQTFTNIKFNNIPTAKKYKGDITVSQG